jgi:hypothetical protein
MRQAGERDDIGFPAPGLVARMVHKILNRRFDGNPFGLVPHLQSVPLADYHDDDEHQMCSRCGCCKVERRFSDCHGCGGDGFFDEYEDPINGSPGELIACSECGGKGGESWDYCDCNDEGAHHRCPHCLDTISPESRQCWRCKNEVAPRAGVWLRHEAAREERRVTVEARE